jgi:hypothetical protein
MVNRRMSVPPGVNKLGQPANEQLSIQTITNHDSPWSSTAFHHEKKPYISSHDASDQGWEPLNLLQYIEWIDDQRQFNSINIEV